MLARELLPMSGGVDRIVDVTPEHVDLVAHLAIPDSVRHDRSTLDAVTGDTADAGTVLLAAVGPGLTEPDDLAAALAVLPVGARVLLMCGWPVAELPYHRLLGPLGAGECQVTAAVPLQHGRRHGFPLAVLATRVKELLPPSRYLMGTDDQPGHTDPAGGDVVATDPLATMLRMANEHVLGEVVARPARRRLRELDVRISELEASVAAAAEDRACLERALSTSEDALASTRRELAELRSSINYRLGRAVTAVPTRLARAWRVRRTPPL
jgi:hypothetical protein